MIKDILYFYSWGTHFSSCSWVEGGGTVVDGFRSGKVVEDSFGASRYAGDFRGKKQIEVTGERKFRNKLLSVRFSTLNSRQNYVSSTKADPRVLQLPRLGPHHFYETGRHLLKVCATAEEVETLGDLLVELLRAR